MQKCIMNAMTNNNLKVDLTIEKEKSQFSYLCNYMFSYLVIVLDNFLL